jgi:transcriptional regulator GlxA family with amidase domain
VRTSSRNFAVLLFDEVELWDVTSVMHVASLAGRHWNWRPFRLLPVSATTGWITTRSQLRLEAAFDLENCPQPEVLFIPGGYGARRAASERRFVDWCAVAAPQAGLVLAIGAGAMILGAAGLLAGSEVAAATDNVEWMRPALPHTSFDTSSAIVASSLGGVADKLLTTANGKDGLELGLRAVERCLGARLAGHLRSTLGLPAPPTRLEVRDLPKITRPPR